LPLNFVRSDKKPEDFCESLIDSSSKYNAFQIICFQRDENDQYEVVGLANHFVDKIEVVKFPPGIYGFGNSPSSKPFKKIQRGVSRMKEIIEKINTQRLSEEETIERLMQLATDKHQQKAFFRCFPDEQLKQQCRRSNELCRYRTAIFVQFPDGIPYGTRSHTIVLVDRNNRATFYEKAMDAAPKRASEANWTERTFHFDLV
uniref:Rap-GAP domain-containing protein n=1 Tax=Gongylonema pulchrum TaxID=637853 RepID=A0A183EMA3_9BILA